MNHAHNIQHNQKISLLLGALSLFSANLLAQRKPVAKDVGIEIHQNNVIINYKIKSSEKGSTHLVFLNFIDEQYNLVIPNLLTGNIGTGVLSGVKNSIVWDVTNDVQQFGSTIIPVIFIDGYSKQFSNTGGPRNAILSIILPGLGDYFVADPKMMTFKPYMRTISSLGLIGLGIYAGNQQYHAEGNYRTVETVQAGWNRPYAADKYKEIYIEGELQNWLFKGDREVLISLGAVIWFADIIWVFAKGNNNERFLKSSNRGSNFKLGAQQGYAGFSYSYTF